MAGSRKNITRPKLFSAAITREESKIALSQKVRMSALKDTNFKSTSSFRYDESGMGLKSTQEIDLDWTQFSNHVFFNSAQSNVNIAFDKIINHYPFQGSMKQIEAFEDSLTGYEKYILDNFPRNKGYLIFSGTSKTENPEGGFASGLGTYIPVKDVSGATFPLFSKNKSGKSSINFEKNPFAFEMWIYVPQIQNENQIICQKRDNEKDHITLCLSQSASETTVPLMISVGSGSANLFVSASIEKGKFSHICGVYDRGNLNNLQLYLSESMVASSSMSYEFGSLSFGQSDFLIGSGSRVKFKHKVSGGETVNFFDPVQTLSGALDEFRVFHTARSIVDQQKYSIRSVSPDNNLRLYLKFNEPDGEYGAKSVVLDSSGKSLHSKIVNYTDSLRLTGSFSGQPENPMSGENLKRCPVLFPDFSLVSSMNTDLLASASYYDNYNPNLITRLFPIHYLLEGQQSQGFTSQEGQIPNPISGDSIPGSAKIGSAQYLTAFMLVWAKFFDEIKIFIDHFSKSTVVDYDNSDSISRKLLPFIADFNGISLPNIFPNTNPEQYIMGEDILDKFSKSENSLKFVQSEIWKRILINMSDIFESKGTVHSIKSLIRAAGINPDNLLTIREYGGPTQRSLSGLRETKTEVANSLDFSGSLINYSVASSEKYNGFSSRMPHIVSPFLTGTRVEVGFPKPVGEMILKDQFYPHGISNNRADGLLTSGSWTYEGIYQFERKRQNVPFKVNQSLVRFNVSASAPVAGGLTDTKGVSYLNLMFISGTHNSLTSSGGTLRLYARPGMAGATDPLLRLQLTGVNIFDGNLWNVSFGRERSDQIRRESGRKYTSKKISDVGSSSYFLRCARQSFGEIKEIFTTAAYFMESFSEDSNAMSSFNGLLNPSGTMMVIGSQSLASDTFGTSPYDVYLNDQNLESRPGAHPGDFNRVMVTDFQGQVSQIRFWSKALEMSSWKEHVRNFKSVGVKDPLINFNFETKPTGSFERLRVDASVDQATLKATSEGNLRIFDFSQNDYHLEGSGFDARVDSIKPETFYFSHLSPKFDVAATDNKIRVRSYKDPELLDDNPYASSAPRYEVLKSEEPDDDTRFTIEFSSMKAIDEDIMNLLGDLEFFDNALGHVNLLFDDFYPDIEQMRKVYFNRLTEKPDFQLFFEMYRWFNTSLGELIGQLIPRKTKFLGINFVIESHVLERNKFRYLFDEIYLLALTRNTDRGNLLLSQVVGDLKKF